MYKWTWTDNITIKYVMNHFLTNKLKASYTHTDMLQRIQHN